MMMCQACERDDHANCGLQTWCECDCDPETAGYYFPAIDEELQDCIQETEESD
jgi:hypothetical protein